MLFASASGPAEKAAFQTGRWMLQFNSVSDSLLIGRCQYSVAFVLTKLQKERRNGFQVVRELDRGTNEDGTPPAEAAFTGSIGIVSH